MVFAFEHQQYKPTVPKTPSYVSYVLVSLVHDCTGSSLRICEVPYKPYGAIRHCTDANQNSKLQSGIQTKQNYQNIPTLHHDDPTNSNIIGVGWIIMAGSRHRIGKHECCCMLYHCFLSHMVYCCLVATGCHFDNMAGDHPCLACGWQYIIFIHKPSMETWWVFGNLLYSPCLYFSNLCVFFLWPCCRCHIRRRWGHCGKRYQRLSSVRMCIPRGVARCVQRISNFPHLFFPLSSSLIPPRFYLTQLFAVRYEFLVYF
jgi:hypothetical protein